MEISARKKSNDPLQENLREHKDLWNASTKNLISKLIAFKRGINGRGDLRAGLPPSDIKNPIPNEIVSYLSHLSDDYVSVIKGAEQIIYEQAQYSESRKQSGQIQLANDQLITEASWWGSQIWAKTFGIKKNKKYLVRMLNSAIDLKSQLLDTENILSSSDPNAIQKAFYKASSFGLGSYNSIIRNFDLILTDNKMEVSETAETAPVVTESVETPTVVEPVKDDIDWDKINDIYRDSTAMIVVLNLLIESEKLDSSQIDPFLDVPVFNVLKYRENWPTLDIKQKQETLNYYNKVIKNYFQLKFFAESVLENQFDNFKAMIPFAKNLVKKVVVSHNPVTRYLKRKWLERPFFRNKNVDSAKTLAIDAILKTIETINKLMDGIEKKLSLQDIFVLIQNCTAALSKVYESLIILAGIHNNEYDYNIRSSKQHQTNISRIRDSQLNSIKRRMMVMKSLLNKTLI